jgi:hypothetical protein
VLARHERLRPFGSAEFFQCSPKFSAARMQHSRRKVYEESGPRLRITAAHLRGALEQRLCSLEFTRPDQRASE